MSDIGDARARLTLAFVDPALERDYQAAVAVSNGAQLRMGTLAGVALWLVAAVLIPLTLSVDADAFADLAEPADDYWSARSELAWN